MCRLVLLFLTACTVLHAAPSAPEIPPPPIAELRPRDAIILGLVEGITEFLPVSSTGHLIIANEFLELTDETPLTDAEGQLLWHKAPDSDHPKGEPLTLKLAADTFTVVIQVGAIAAVILIYWARFVDILAGVFGRSASGLRLLRNIVVACVPAVVFGLILEKLNFEEHFFSIGAVIAALVLGALLMFAAERWRRTQASVGSERLEPADLTVKQSLKIGLMQCLALWPGMSRSMCTMVGGYFAGLAPARAAEFSFLVGLPILAGAAMLKGYKSGPAMIAVFGWEPVILGTTVAAVSAALAVKFLVSYLGRRGLGVFASYRLTLAAALAAWFLL